RGSEGLEHQQLLLVRGAVRLPAVVRVVRVVRVAAVGPRVVERGRARRGRGGRARRRGRRRSRAVGGRRRGGGRGRQRVRGPRRVPARAGEREAARDHDGEREPDGGAGDLGGDWAGGHRVLLASSNDRGAGSTRRTPRRVRPRPPTPVGIVEIIGYACT